MAVTVRQLPAEEWPRLIEAGIEPFATVGLPEPGHWVLLVAEEDGKILACSSLVETVQNHLYVVPSARPALGPLLALWNLTLDTLTQAGVSSVCTTVPDSQPAMKALVERVGYVPADGTLYALFVPQAMRR